MELVDSHCHLDFEPLGSTLPQVLSHAQEAGVAYMLCVSVNLQAYPGIRVLARTHKHIFASVGVHPNERPAAEPTTADLVNLGQDPMVVAIGETGLDYFRSQGPLDWQRERFRRHIQAARQIGKPLIIHMRDAAVDTLDLLRSHRADEAGGVMHCFTEDWTVARQALDLGFYISFSGIVTFKNAVAVQAVARKAPLDRILLETDSPYLAPVPHRGRTNEPAYTRHTAAHVAELRSMPLDELAAATTDNFFRLFTQARR